MRDQQPDSFPKQSGIFVMIEFWRFVRGRDVTTRQADCVNVVQEDDDGDKTWYATLRPQQQSLCDYSVQPQPSRSFPAHPGLRFKPREKGEAGMMEAKPNQMARQCRHHNWEPGAQDPWENEASSAHHHASKLPSFHASTLERLRPPGG
ncbi:hypothetical protein DHEL01_v210084 [Diaporthe helianthi]|uniref:Uncharacterized protein n=1 Tax=Diaporthe helianthi TaxID=158607 RepID=A0A2P5HMN9_DIAHE|nr:hypothetical protein DHEL01_v210084 [Diaporthe helianthi]